MNDRLARLMAIWWPASSVHPHLPHQQRHRREDQQLDRVVEADRHADAEHQEVPAQAAASAVKPRQ